MMVGFDVRGFAFEASAKGLERQEERWAWTPLSSDVRKATLPKSCLMVFGSRSPIPKPRTIFLSCKGVDPRLALGHGVADSCKVTRVALDVLQWADHFMTTVWLLVHTLQ